MSVDITGWAGSRKPPIPMRAPCPICPTKHLSIDVVGNTHWTGIELDTLQRLYEREGIDRQTIGKILGRSIFAVDNKIDRMHFTRKVKIAPPVLPTIFLEVIDVFTTPKARYVLVAPVK